VLALDLGGTQIRAAVVLPTGDRIGRVAVPTPVAEGPAAIVRACAEALVAVRDRVPRALRAELAAIGISSPGPVDPFRGVVVEPPNLGPDFRDIPLAAEMADALGLRAVLDRDTNVAALAEHAYGAARDCADFLYLTVSTGIGGAIVTGGRLFRGPDGTAGELGHMPVDMDGPACGCGGAGHLEAVSSGRALARDAREAVLAGRSPFLAARAAERSPEALTARDVAEGEEAGDPVAGALMARARHAFATACVGYVDMFNPDRIVVGGSIADAQGERWLAPARRAVASEAFRTPARRVRIVPAALGPDVSLAGAQPLVSDRLGATSVGAPVTSPTR
jgi:glucokinase